MVHFVRMRATMLLLSFSVCFVSCGQAGIVKKSALASLLSYKWAITAIAKEEGMKNTDKKIYPFDASPAELPNTIEFLSNGTLLVNLKKGTWKTTAKDKVRIVLEGMLTSYRVHNLQNQKVKLYELKGEKKILLLTRLN